VYDGTYGPKKDVAAAGSQAAKVGKKAIATLSHYSRCSSSFGFVAYKNNFKS
jgi:hypothetical protein